jgi:hypothetical protein
MKKLALILFIFISVLSFGQEREQSITWLRVEDLTNTRYFIWQGDTIDFSFLGDSLVVLKSDSLVLFITPSQLSDSLNAHSGTHDAVTLAESATTGGLSLDGQEIGFQEATNSQNGYLSKEDHYSFNNKISYVSHDTTMTGNGTESDVLSVNENIIAPKEWVRDSFLLVDGNLIGTFDGKTSDVYLNYDSLNNLPTIPVISNVAYGSSWDSNLDGASKNAIYDKIESSELSNNYFEKELSDSENNIDVGFTLDSLSVIFFNGKAIPQDLWSGEGTTTINLSLSTKDYDFLIVKQ